MKKVLFFVLILLCFFNTNAQQNSENDKSSVFKAKYTYSFAKSIEWPVSVKVLKYFSIAILSNNEKLINQFEEISKTKKVGNQEIKIGLIKDLTRIDTFQILFFDKTSLIKIEDVIQTIANKPVLLVTDEEVDFNNFMINFITKNNRLSYAVNAQKLEQNGLKVGSNLLTTAASVSNSKEGSEVMIFRGKEDWDNLMSKYMKDSSKSNISVSKNDLVAMNSINISQKKKIEQQLDEIDIKLKQIEQQKTLILSQQYDINLQKKELEKLLMQTEQSKKELGLAKSEIDLTRSKLKKQLEELALAQEELNSQNTKLNKQKSEILIQQNKIIQQKETLGSQESQLRTQKLALYSFISVLVIVTVFSIFVYRNYKEKKKTSEKLAALNSEITHQKKEITDSINYSKRIQQAIMSPIEDVTKALPGCFILYQPKDVVSGDFYFFHQDNNTVCIAACDCTGHGVPGAFMSLIGSKELNIAVSSNSSPSKILEAANKGVKSTLKQHHTSGTKDGMDMALVTLEKVAEFTNLKYAGANRPLWLLKNNEADIFEIKATKQAIGGFTDYNQTYEEHSLQLSKGDCIYMFSDGYPDQFGGEKGKKLMTKNFKEILISIRAKSATEQKEHLENFFLDWRGANEQVDDLLIIGIKIT